MCGAKGCSQSIQRAEDSFYPRHRANPFAHPSMRSISHTGEVLRFWRLSSRWLCLWANPRAHSAPDVGQPLTNTIRSFVPAIPQRGFPRPAHRRDFRHRG